MTRDPLDPIDPIDPIFSGLDAPLPPEGLREEALRAAREAFRREAPTDRWTRALRSPALRLAWAASVAALAAAHLLLPASPRSRAVVAVVPASADGRDIADIARLPRIDARALPRLGAVAAREGDHS
jgi:hypothetical protein